MYGLIKSKEVGFGILQFSLKMFRYIFMTLGYQVPLPFEEDLSKEIFLWNFIGFAEHLYKFAKGDFMRSNKISLYSGFSQVFQCLLQKLDSWSVSLK